MSRTQPENSNFSGIHNNIACVEYFLNNNYIKK